ncbi:flavodoxin [Companilactobacillus kimchiensis]|uniref:Flavodoxin n=1 Tax=Companilactobacillus kimchiensis TaxID=993692 RepID=A0A0R2LL25_9LACO|nr:flavodoxin [Companilactobacillus kimchiensis]KRN98868.1 flavodoxin [Companilactobacillus kimchiensis]
MRKRIIAFISAIVVILVAIVGYNVYNRQASSESTTANKQVTKQVTKKSTTTNKKNGKTLIVYFSRTDGVSGGHLKVGHTKVVADFIQKHTGADEYEIQAAKPYPKSYQATADQAQKEQQDNARPKIKGTLPDVSKYDTVFIGAPVWWGEYPMIVRTFMDATNLDGKTVIPFTTHMGSGLGNTQEQLKEQYPKSKVRDGLGVEGTDANNSQKTVDNWLNKLGY